MDCSEINLKLTKNNFNPHALADYIEKHKDTLDNKIPVNNTYFKDLDQDVQDVFLGSTYLEEECYIYKHKGKIKNFPKKLKKEIFKNLTNSQNNHN